MQTAMVCTLQKPPQRQRWGERPEGRSGSTGERGRRGEQRQDRGRPCRFLGGESAGGHVARRAADREGVSAAPSPPRRESRAHGEGAARHTEPAEAPGPAQAGAAPQGHPPCRAERRRPHVTRALGAATSPGGATRRACSRAGAPSGRRPPPGWSRGGPRPRRRPWRSTSTPAGRACTSSGTAPHAADASLGPQGRARRVLWASPPSQTRSGPGPERASWKPATRRTACAVARGRGPRWAPWMRWRPGPSRSQADARPGWWQRTARSAWLPSSLTGWYGCARRVLLLAPCCAASGSGCKPGGSTPTDRDGPR